MKLKIQFDIRTILIVVFIASIALAIYSQSDSIVAGVLVTVLLANFAGVMLALIITFVMRFPRDGGFRDQGFDNECGTDLQTVNEK